MIVYLSGPILDQPDRHKPAFDEAEKRLTALGHDVINPARRECVPGWGWRQHQRLNLADLLEADAIAQLDGWRLSRGALLECRVADELGLTKVDPAVVA